MKQREGGGRLPLTCGPKLPLISGAKPTISCSNQLSQKYKLLENGEFNNLTIVLTNAKIKGSHSLVSLDHYKKIIINTNQYFAFSLVK